MTNYYVLTPPGSSDPEKDTRFIRDGFSWLAFFFPLPWLLIRKLWPIAGLAAIFYVITVLSAEYLGLDALPIAFAFILSLWTGLEGGHVRATWLQRKGWDLKANITANNVDEAEALYFEGMGRSETTSAPIMRNTGGGAVSHPSSNVALGLIGPYGSR